MFYLCLFVALYGIVGILGFVVGLELMLASSNIDGVFYKVNAKKK